jgi:hypothetical protein
MLHSKSPRLNAGRFRITDLSIQDLASVAEILGAVAVVASLVYLGRQIHQTNAQSQADARFACRRSPGGRAFWNDVGKLGVHNDFKNAVDKILASEETSYEIV